MKTSKKTVLITGANGEIGHGLISHLADTDNVSIIALDLNPIDKDIRKKCTLTVVGDILNASMLENLSTAHDFDTIYHLAALLSTRAERQPPLAHRVNVDGTLNLLELAANQARVLGRPVTFLFPSSIAVYGLATLDAKRAHPRVAEDQWLTPRTMYGVNKFYCEQLGSYYARYYRQLDADSTTGTIDFRSIRFPGLISAATLPTGGTSDYASEMLHQAAQSMPYACFVREDARIPFMAMPDGIRALLELEAAPRQRLTRQVYNIGAFNPSAGELRKRVLAAYPKADITFAPDLKRQTIVDSWPEDVDDTAARKDWGWKPAYDEDKAFTAYLLPSIRARYG